MNSLAVRIMFSVHLLITGSSNIFKRSVYTNVYYFVNYLNIHNSRVYFLIKIDSIQKLLTLFILQVENQIDCFDLFDIFIS